MSAACLTVYVCTYNEEANIGPCLESLYAAGATRIKVVDSSPVNSTAREAVKHGAEVVKAPRGLATQRQVAIDDCLSEFLMFVDADDRLEKSSIQTLLAELHQGKYDAIQASLRVYRPRTYWQKGMDANLNYCINSVGPTNMVGRPAIYRTACLKKVGMDVSFDGVGNEDAALSIRLEKMGASQGKGSGISYRHHPGSFSENFNAWKKYGMGDAQLIRQYPEKLWSIIGHLVFNYPLKRSWAYIVNGKGRYCGYPVLVGLVRLFFLAKCGVFNRRANSSS